MNKNKMRRVFVAIGLLIVSAFATANDHEFTVSEIEVRGNDRTDLGTVLNYLPISAGDSFRPQSETGRLIRALYDTGLFSDVSLSRRGDVLVVNVVERPIISSIDFSGNSKVEDEQLEESLRLEGIYRGRVFNRSVLETVERELRRVYSSTGNYSMRLTTTIQELDRNRVAIDIDISEGSVARIQHINIVGNDVFEESDLLDLFESDTEANSAFSYADEYSRFKLEGDLEILRSYYLDRGYINFNVDSTQVSISPDKNNIYITINITEGEQYTIGDIILSGKLIFPKEELMELLLIESGQAFSRQKVIASRTALTERLGDDAYAFANINVSNETDDENRLVNLNFVIDPGKRVYVNRITFSGHDATSDFVFRREMRLIEGSRFSPAELNRSRVRLQRLPFIASVQIETPRVPGTDDLIDVNVLLEEGASGSFQAGAGIGTNGVSFNIGVTEENFLGTGNRIAFDFDNSDSLTRLSTEYGQPYYTIDGVSRTISAHVSETDASEISSTTDYIADTYGIGIRYSVPISEFSRFRTGAEFENTKITRTDSTSDEIINFLDDNGSEFDLTILSVGYSYDDRDRTIFAEDGALHSLQLSASLPSSDLEYYKLGYRFEYYYPIDDVYVFSMTNRLDYGAGYGDQENLPFFQRYFAGGVRLLRGFRNRSLGPEDSTGDAAGGDFRTLNTFEVIFPPSLSSEKGQTRMSLFTDFGNVFEDYQSYDGSEIRASWGISFVWFAPFAPMSFSLAQPYRSEDGDSLQEFQFTLGSVF
ncbi:MAG: outer membrane protein assembly factor BamA [Pseudomonadota bacterium]